MWDAAASHRFSLAQLTASAIRFSEHLTRHAHPITAVTPEVSR